MPQIYELLIEADRRDRIAQHGITVREVEEVCYGSPFVVRTLQRRVRAIGQTLAGRYVTVILRPGQRGVYTLITAREALEAERRRLDESRGRT